jgi:hypothetical protein
MKILFAHLVQVPRQSEVGDLTGLFLQFLENMLTVCEFGPKSPPVDVKLAFSGGKIAEICRAPSFDEDHQSGFPNFCHHSTTKDDDAEEHSWNNSMWPVNITKSSLSYSSAYDTVLDPGSIH